MLLMRLIAPIGALLLSACGPFARGQDLREIHPQDLVVCVQNDLAGYGAVTARAEQARFQVMPGATQCRRVPTAGARLTLTATTIGGGAAGPLSFAEPLPSAGPGCWLWRLGPARADALSRIDCDEVAELQGRAWPATRSPVHARSDAEQVM